MVSPPSTGLGRQQILPPMEMGIRHLCVVAAVALSVACAPSEQGATGSDVEAAPSAALSSPAPSEAAASSAGAAFTASDAFFSAVFVDAPQRFEETYDGVNGTYPITIYGNDFEDGSALGITFSNFAEVGEQNYQALAAALLDAAIANIAEQNGGTVVSETRVDFAGTTAVDGLIEVPEGVQHVRAMLLPPGHGYTFFESASEGAPRSPEFERLLSSFTHLPG